MQRHGVIAVFSVGFAAALTATVACSSTSGGTSSGFGTSSGGSSGVLTGSDAGGDAGSGLNEAGTPPPPKVSEVYGHSASTLYRLDPVTKAVTTVGDLRGCTSAIDLAINAQGEMYATLSGGIYPNSLSFVPAGTLLPNREALVGYSGPDYVQIDLQSFAVTTIRSKALGTKYGSSGDIVSVIGGNTYLTAYGQNCAGDAECTRCTTQDCLLQVDPATGALLKNLGPVGYSAVYGLSFWAGSVYGFTAGGALFEIDLSKAKLESREITIPNRPGNLSFNCAGSTTAAPLVPVN
jgi:hypothetical protein